MKRLLVVFLLLLGACSPVMEATRPDPVDLSQFQLGDSRTHVVETLGSVGSSFKEPTTGEDCDLYNLYTHGPGTVGKVTISFLEVVADVFTLGLAEILFTPAEAATRNSLHPVTICYKDAKLTSVTEK